MNEVFLDTETTGLSFRDGHKIVEIACIETKDLIATGKVFHKLINPKRSMPEEAFKIHGFSQKFLNDKETFEQVADEFLNFIKDKKIILIDDSLVRGTTSHKIVKMLYDAGAKEVHVKIACPEIRYPDFYGVDTPTRKELLAANKSNDEICEYIGAKSLKFLSIDGMYRAIGFDKRNENYPQLTDHYFTGEYPVKPIDELGDNKITQLSLLNTASNN